MPPADGTNLPRLTVEPPLRFPSKPDFATVARQLNRDMAESFEAIRPGYVPGEMSRKQRGLEE